MTTITLNKGGTAARTVEAESLIIPDLWHIASWLDTEADRDRDRPASAIAELHVQADKIRAVWNIAHDLKRHIIEAKPEREPTTEAALSWANQQSYSGSGAALDDYCKARGLSWSDDAMYAYVTFTEES